MKQKFDAVLSRQELKKSSQLDNMHWIVIFASVILTFLAWYLSNKNILARHELRFERYSDQIASQVIERMALYKNALQGGIAFIEANNRDITPQQWRKYSTTLNIVEAYPGIHGLGVISYLKKDELQQFIQTQQVRRPNFTVFPQHNENEYWPITLIEPIETNQAALGLDMAFENNRFTAIKKARDLAKPQITGPIELVQDSEKTPGFLFYAPFYNTNAVSEDITSRQQEILGVVYAPFIIKNLMKGTLAQEQRLVKIMIIDDGQIIYNDSDTANNNLVTPSRFSRSEEINMYGRVWRFYFESNKQFEDNINFNQSRFILVGGIIIDVMLFVVFVSITRANRNALRHADKVTQILEHETRELAKTNKDLEQFTYVASHDLKSPLNAIKQLVNWIVEDCEDILPEESKKHLALLSQRSARMETLLSDLLQYSRLSKQDLVKEKINLKALSNDICFVLNTPPAFQVIAPDVEIGFVPEPLEIIFRNLISNAIKHHDKDAGTIIINYQEKGDFCILKFIDDGPGIPADYHQKVLEMFQTLQPRDKVEGSGMGLAIVKRIMENIEGTITIESDGEHGSTIILSWPKKYTNNEDV